LYFLLQPPAGALSPTEVLTPAPRGLPRADSGPGDHVDQM